jgi:DNA-binding beta-propeller fold protein YncE
MANRSGRVTPIGRGRCTAAHTIRALAVIVVATIAPTLPGWALEDPTTLTGTVVVLNKRGDDASFIDLASGRIVATAPTGRGPHELAMSADGRIAVGTDYEGQGGSLSVFDVAAGERTKVIDLVPYTRPHGIAFLPGDETVAVTVEAQRAVIIVRIADGEIVGVAPTEAAGSHMVAMTADGKTMWTGDIGANTITEFDTATRRRRRALPAPDQPEAITVTPGGDRVFVGSNATGRVTVFDTARGSSRTIAEGFGWPYRMFLTPDATRLIVPDLRRGVLRFFDARDYRELGLIELAGRAPQGLTLHADGRHLFLSLSGANRVAVIDIDERQVVGSLPAGDSPDGIGYSPIAVRSRNGESMSPASIPH